MLFFIVLLPLGLIAQTRISFQTGLSSSYNLQAQQGYEVTEYKKKPFTSYRLTVSKTSKQKSNSVLNTEFGFSFSRDGYRENISYRENLLGTWSIFDINTVSSYYFLEGQGGVRVNFKALQKRFSALVFFTPSFLIVNKITTKTINQDGISLLSKITYSFSRNHFGPGSNNQAINLSGGVTIAAPIKLTDNYTLNIGPQFRTYFFKTNKAAVPFNRQLYSIGLNFDLQHISKNTIEQRQAEPKDTIKLKSLFYRNHISIEAGYLFKHTNFKTILVGSGTIAHSFSSGWLFGGNYFFNFPDRFSLSLGLNYTVQHYIIKYVFFPYNGHGAATSNGQFSTLQIPLRAILRLKTGEKTYITPFVGIRGVYNFTNIDTLNHYVSGADSTNIYYNLWGPGWHKTFNHVTTFKEVINPELGLGVNYVLSNRNIVNLNIRCTYERNRVKGTFSFYEKATKGSGSFYERGYYFSLDVNYIFSRSKNQLVGARR